MKMALNLHLVHVLKKKHEAYNNNQCRDFYPVVLFCIERKTYIPSIISLRYKMVIEENSHWNWCGNSVN